MEQNKKPTLAFVDYSFHKKTGSGDFLRELFSENFTVIDFWDDSWQKGNDAPVEEINKCDYVFYFQIINPPEDLKKITAKIIWAPMYDGLQKDAAFWKRLSFIPIKILSFSDKVFAYCQKYKIDAINIKYFKNPEKYQADIPKTGRHIFFWYRGSLKFEELKKHLNSSEIDSFTYLTRPDPKYKKEIITAEDQKNFKMKIADFDFTADGLEYLKLISSANIFISPRKKEGIGMSLLEAMAMGMATIGNNDATMNEYIIPEKNGYLFNLSDEKKIDFSDLKEVVRNSLDYAKKGYEDWLKSMPQINNFLLSDYRAGNRNKLAQISCFAYYGLINKLKSLKSSITGSIK